MNCKAHVQQVFRSPTPVCGDHGRSDEIGFAGKDSWLDSATRAGFFLLSSRISLFRYVMTVP